MKKIKIFAAAIFLVLTNVGCNQQDLNKQKGNEVLAIFPKGEKGPAQNFTGNAWNIGLVTNDTIYNTIVGNVYFEPGARSNWHTHPA